MNTSTNNNNSNKLTIPLLQRVLRFVRFKKYTPNKIISLVTTSSIFRECLVDFNIIQQVFKSLMDEELRDFIVNNNNKKKQPSSPSSNRHSMLLTTLDGFILKLGRKPKGAKTLKWVIESLIELPETQHFFVRGHISSGSSTTTLDYGNRHDQHNATLLSVACSHPPNMAMMSVIFEFATRKFKAIARGEEKPSPPLEKTLQVVASPQGARSLRTVSKPLEDLIADHFNGNMNECTGRDFPYIFADDVKVQFVQFFFEKLKELAFAFHERYYNSNNTNTNAKQDTYDFCVFAFFIKAYDDSITRVFQNTAINNSRPDVFDFVLSEMKRVHCPEKNRSLFPACLQQPSNSIPFLQDVVRSNKNPQIFKKLFKLCQEYKLTDEALTGKFAVRVSQNPLLHYACGSDFDVVENVEFLLDEYDAIKEEENEETTRNENNGGKSQTFLSRFCTTPYTLSMTMMERKNTKIFKYLWNRLEKEGGKAALRDALKNERSEDYDNLISYSARHGNTKILHILLESARDLGVFDHLMSQRTSISNLTAIMMIAAEWRKEDETLPCVKLILAFCESEEQCQKYLNELDNRNRTPAFIAECDENGDIADWLRDKDVLKKSKKWYEKEFLPSLFNTEEDEDDEEYYDDDEYCYDC